MIDYRLPENRREAFKRFWVWQLKTEDCDPAIYMTNYIFKRMQLNDEQKLWVAWLYANTYYLPTSWVIWNEFPDMHLVGLERLDEWNTENYKRLRYQTDTKYNKGHLPTMFRSYKEWVGDKTQRERFNEICTSDDPEMNFWLLWEEINKEFYKFGRYTAWFYMQHLAHCCSVNVRAPNLMLVDSSGSHSHRDGLCYALGLDDKMGGRKQKVDPNFAATLEWQAKLIIMEIQKEYPEVAAKADMFAMETSLCAFKKLSRKKKGRYLGYYLDRQAEEIKTVERDGWNGIYWQLLWDARKETLIPELLHDMVDENKMEHFLDTGTLAGLERFWNDEPETDNETSILRFA
ncbi:MAG: hypothetical protein ACO2ZZ_13595 [Cyclobacteriaceae bacterium]